MKKLKLLLLITLLFNSFSTFSQLRRGSPCDRKLYTFTDNPSQDEKSLIDEDFDKFLVNYVKKYGNSEDTIHLINNKQDLIPMLKTHCLPFFGEFFLFYTKENKFFNLKITSKKVVYELERDSLNLAYLIHNEPILLSIKNQSYWGNVTYDVIDKKVELKEIKSISLELNDTSLSIPIAFFQDLKNPNTCFQYFTNKPIEAYYSPKTESTYIYIYGKNFDLTSTSEESYDDISRRSFFAKIIIDKNRKISRIVIPSTYLGYYGWKSCFDFWVF